MVKWLIGKAEDSSISFYKLLIIKENSTYSSIYSCDNTYIFYIYTLYNLELDLNIGLYLDLDLAYYYI